MRITVLSVILSWCVAAVASNSSTGAVKRATAKKVVLTPVTWCSHAAEPSSGVSPDEFIQDFNPKDQVTESSYVDFGYIVFPSSQRESISFSAETYDPAQKMKLAKEWYDMFQAAYGSRAYWILLLARARAENGESVSDLKDRFDATIRSWINSP